MACRPFVGPNGAVGFMCGPQGPRKACSAPGCTDRATKACDFPVNRPGKKSRTCDADLCDRHATSMGDGLDWCPPHVRYAKDHEDG